MSRFGSTVIKTTLSCAFMSRRPPPRKPKVSDVFQVKGPPKRFFLKNETSEQAKPKVTDLEDMEVDEGHEDPEGDEKEAAKVPATPGVEDVPVVPEADEIAQARREGWAEVDLKGNGDCAFRCIAAAREFFEWKGAFPNRK